LITRLLSYFHGAELPPPLACWRCACCWLPLDAEFCGAWFCTEAPPTAETRLISFFGSYWPDGSVTTATRIMQGMCSSSCVLDGVSLPVACRISANCELAILITLSRLFMFL